jgi:putative endonuclease
MRCPICDYRFPSEADYDAHVPCEEDLVFVSFRKPKRAEPRWFLYVLLCADGTLYAGITTDFERRIRQHNGELAGGAKYTRARRPVTLWAVKSYDDRSSASKAEYRFKKLSRAEKLKETKKWT